LLTFTFISLSNPNKSEQLNPELKEIYESRKMQLEFILSQNTPVDSLIFSFMKEADFFAEYSDYGTALEILNDGFEYYSSKILPNISTNDTANMEIDPFILWPVNYPTLSKSWELILEFGSDYSRQEYELSFIESDSLILEELFNPYTTIRLLKNSRIKNKNFQFNTYVRGDKSLLQSSLYMSLESSNINQNWRLEGQSDVFWLTESSESNFWNNELGIYWNRLLNHQNRLFIKSRFRYKAYLNSEPLYSNILNAEAFISLRHSFRSLSWFEFMIRPTLYRESQLQGINYEQIQSQVNFNNRADYNKYINIYTDYTFRNFQSSQFEMEYKNQYHAVRSNLDTEYPVSYPFGLRIYFDGESRWFTSPDITYSNFILVALAAELKYYFGPYRSVGLGYIYEVEKHSTDLESEGIIVAQENFDARGLIFSFEILSFQGLMISLNYQYLLRTFPNAGAQDFIGLYSNRRIHTVQGFGYIPMTPHWQFQFFANYDADRDRDRESNDSNSAIFNIGFLYKF
jgi:hypothetical protein